METGSACYCPPTRAGLEQLRLGSTVTEELARSHANSLVSIHLTPTCPFWHLFQKPKDVSRGEQRFSMPSRNGCGPRALTPCGNAGRKLDQYAAQEVIHLRGGYSTPIDGR